MTSRSRKRLKKSTQQVQPEINFTMTLSISRALSLELTGERAWTIERFKEVRQSERALKIERVKKVRQSEIVWKMMRMREVR